jgi:dienelactone hydrolase
MAGSSNGGNGGSAAGGESGGSGGAGGGGSMLPPVTDYSKPGPFATTVDMKVGPDGGYTAYRPATLGENGFKHSPIIFGPGIGQSVTVHTAMLTNFASHGFVVLGTPVLNGGPGAPGNLKLMQDGLDWILAQNEAAGSVYQGKLDVKRAVSMGYSVGGTSAVQLGGHPAVATTVSIHGHTAMSAMHGPLLQTTGTKDTVGMPLQQSTYDMSQVQTFLATLTGADHGYIQNAGGGDERPAIVAWLRYWLNGDQGAKHYFFGNDCVLCQAPWQNPQRKNWP